MESFFPSLFILEMIFSDTILIGVKIIRRNIKTAEKLPNTKNMSYVQSTIGMVFDLMENNGADDMKRLTAVKTVKNMTR